MRLVLLICCFLVMLNSAVHAVELNDGPRARAALQTQVREMFAAGKFAELDAMADRYRTFQTKFTDGIWRLMIFYQAFHLDVNVPDPYFQNQIALASEWRKSRPTSVAAQVALAEVWRSYAWHRRGEGFANEVKKEAWPVFRENLDKAWTIINEPLAPGVKDCPGRQGEILQIAQERGIERAKYEALFQQALRQEPQYYTHYARKLTYLLPRWSGKEGEWQKYLSGVYDSNPNGQGALLYARTAWAANLVGAWSEFDGSGVSWPIMKKGFGKIQEENPTSEWILNTFAMFACKAKDRDTLLPLLKEIPQSRLYQEAWREETVDDCRKWAGLPTFKELTQRNLSDKFRSFEDRVEQNKRELAERARAEKAKEK